MILENNINFVSFTSFLMARPFNRESFDKFLVSYGVVEFREKKVKLSSGKKSNLYINLRKLMDDVITFDKFKCYVEDFVYSKGLEPDYFLGVPEGMTKLSLIMTYVHTKEKMYVNEYAKYRHYPLPIARGKEKKHGSDKDKYFLGSLQGKAVVLEDVLTTGSSAINLVKKLKENNAEVLAVIGIVDRLEQSGKSSVAEKFSQLGIQYYCMTDVKTLLPLACEKLKPSEDLVKKINSYYKKNGCEKINI